MPYIPAKYYLEITRPRIFKQMPPTPANRSNRDYPMRIPDVWYQRIDTMSPRQFDQTQVRSSPSGPTTPSRDGWTGD